jgi:hypothetical protein
MSRLSKQCGILNIWQSYRPPRPVTGIALNLLYPYERIRIGGWMLDALRSELGSMALASTVPWLWVQQNTARCLPTHSSWIGCLYCWWTYFHCCVSVSLWFRDGWPERAACLYKVLFQIWENLWRNEPNVEASSLGQTQIYDWYLVDPWKPKYFLNNSAINSTFSCLIVFL